MKKKRLRINANYHGWLYSKTVSVWKGAGKGWACVVDVKPDIRVHHFNQPLLTIVVSAMEPKLLIKILQVTFTGGPAEEEREGEGERENVWREKRERMREKEKFQITFN